MRKNMKTNVYGPIIKTQLELRIEAELESNKRVEEFREEYNSNPKKALEKLLLDYIIRSWHISAQIAVVDLNNEYRPINSDYIKAIELLISLNK